MRGLLHKAFSRLIFKVTICTDATMSPMTDVASSWTYGYQLPLKHNSSFCSVDEEENLESPCNTEAEDNNKSPCTRSKSRLSLNLVGKDKSTSPRNLSKFLRSSFSKLLQITNNNGNQDGSIDKNTPPSGIGTLGPNYQKNPL